ncbi:MAG TPA: hypothetical protein VHA11_10810 [Bryobacteraceae bacterium]|nr:hypothetical protein [Bryobacteraceae bacterium]
MTRLVLALLAAASLGAQPPLVKRDVIATVEQRLDNGIRSLDANEPYDLLGFSRGVYLPGYGVVFSAEMNLVTTLITPFHQQPTGVQLTRLRQKKVQRLTPVREWMRKTLVEAAATLDPVPANEQVVLAITLFYRSFEERDGLPGQIVMQAPKHLLLDYKSNRISKAQLDAGIQVQEL